MQPRPDDVVPQPRDEPRGAVGRERRRVALRDGGERRQIARAHRGGELEVGLQRGAHARGRELGALGHLAEQQAHDDEALGRGDEEAERGRRRLAHGLLEALAGLGVLELDGAVVVGVWIGGVDVVVVFVLSRVSSDVVGLRK